MAFDYPPESRALEVLRGYDQWVVRGGKNGKQPFCPRGGPGSSTNKATWSNFDEACSEVIQLKYSRPQDNVCGIGFVFTTGDPFVGVDLDHCFNQEGELATWAQEIVDLFDSYTEYSPSGYGLHIFIKANLGGHDKGHDNKPSGHKSGGLEIYSWGRYFTFTGKSYHEESKSIKIRQEQLDLTVTRHFGDTKTHQKSDSNIPDIDLNSSPPFEKFDALLENDAKFKKSWHHARRDLNDTSLSGYDMSLATIAAHAGWNDSEITSLIVAHRRKYGGGEKSGRKDYMSGVLRASRTAFNKNLTDGIAQERKCISDASGGTREDILSEVSSQIGVSVTGVVKRGRENAFYYFIIDEKEVLIGGVADLMSIKIVREKVFDVTGKVMDTVKADKWRQIVALFSPIMVFHEVYGGDRVAETEEWIEAYCERANIYRESEKTEAVFNAEPFNQDGVLFLNINRFFDWLGIKGIARGITHAGLRVRFSESGYKTKSFSARVDGEIKTRNYWSR